LLALITRDANSTLNWLFRFHNTLPTTAPMKAAYHCTFVLGMSM
jgi:hypothetical protein